MRTSLYSILCIVVRLGALLLLVNTLVALPWSLAAAMSGAYGETAIGWLVGFSIALLIVACLLWIYPGAIARIAAGRSSQQVFESPIAAADVQYIAFAVLGVWFVVDGLLDLVHVGASLIVAANVGPSGQDELRADALRVLATIIKLAAGLGLAFGGRGLVGLLRGFREHGLPAPAPDDAPAQPRP